MHVCIGIASQHKEVVILVVSENFWAFEHQLDVVILVVSGKNLGIVT
jgi:hypothetical protein